MAVDPKLPPFKQPLDDEGSVIDRVWYRFFESIVDKSKNIDGGSP